MGFRVKMFKPCFIWPLEHAEMVCVCVLCGSHPAACVPRVMTGACTGLKVSSRISPSSSLLSPSLSCTLSSKCAMLPAPRRSWFHFNTFTYTYTYTGKEDKKTKWGMFFNWSSTSSKPCWTKTRKALMKLRFVNPQCGIIFKLQKIFTQKSK